MVAILKTTQIQEPSSATVNVTLDTSGGVSIGQNFAVTGTTTLTGGVASAGLGLKGSSSGTTTLVAQSAASGTVTIPAGTGTAAVQGVSTNIVSGTAQASTSGTSIDFTSIPSWVKRITVMFNGVSTSGTTDILVQLGTGSTTYTTTGYNASSARISYSSTTGGSNSTSGLNISVGGNTVAIYGSMIIQNITGNTWVANHSLGTPPNSNVLVGGGNIALAALLTAIRVTTSNGTDTFDAGSINIMYE